MFKKGNIDWHKNWMEAHVEKGSYAGLSKDLNMRIQHMELDHLDGLLKS